MFQVTNAMSVGLLSQCERYIAETKEQFFARTCTNSFNNRHRPEDRPVLGDGSEHKSGDLDSTTNVEYHTRRMTNWTSYP